jgi:hypothetical protein
MIAVLSGLQNNLNRISVIIKVSLATQIICNLAKPNPVAAMLLKYFFFFDGHVDGQCVEVADSLQRTLGNC